MAKPEDLKTESIKVSTPIGDIESDSGSHSLDLITIVGLIAILYIGKKLADRYIFNTRS